MVALLLGGLAGGRNSDFFGEMIGCSEKSAGTTKVPAGRFFTLIYSRSVTSVSTQLSPNRAIRLTHPQRTPGSNAGRRGGAGNRVCDRGGRGYFGFHLLNSVRSLNFVTLADGATL
jgi:hypothetical protein